MYFPQTRWKEARLTAFQELDQWLSSHTNDNHLAILVGDFSMSVEKISKFFYNNFPE